MVHHIKNLEKNSVVTFNEILRAELQLKQDSLEYITIKNDIKIQNEQMKYYLSAPNDFVIEIDTIGIINVHEKVTNLSDIIAKAHHENQILK